MERSFIRYASGSGFYDEDGGWALIGITVIRSTDFGTNTCTYDASAYSGITFWARGTTPDLGRLYVRVHTTVAPCPLSAICYSEDHCSHFQTRITLDSDADTWTEYFVAFADLAQPAEVAPATFDPSEIVVIDFRVQPIGESGSFDFWIDDLRFYP